MIAIDNGDGSEERRASPIALLLLCVQLAFAIMSLTSGRVVAEPVTGNSHPPIKLSEIREGRLLVREGELERARVVLDQARPSCETEEIERLLLLGHLELRLGIRERAAERFEKVLTLQPDLVQVVRRELSQVYCSSENDSVPEQSGEPRPETSADSLLAALRRRGC